jgi:hypothetical protein
MLKVIFQRAAAIVVALASLAACDAQPLAPAQELARPGAGAANIIYRDAATVPFTFVVYASCVNGGAGEVLQVEGEMEYTGHWITTNGGERQHNIVHASFAGSGTGWDTGEVYDIVSREFWQNNTAYGSDGIPDNEESLQRLRLRATNRATGSVFQLMLVGRVVQAANGEFIIDGWDGKARCE